MKKILQNYISKTVNNYESINTGSLEHMHISASRLSKSLWLCPKNNCNSIFSGGEGVNVISDVSVTWKRIGQRSVFWWHIEEIRIASSKFRIIQASRWKIKSF